MTDREKVIALLERYVRIPNLAGAENYGAKIVDMPAPLITDAIALLKAQEPRVMTLEELRMNEVYWAEQENITRPWPIAMHHIRNAGLLDGPVYQDYMGEDYNTKEYGKKWRVWTSCPTGEVMEATPWN